jgi:hypothetical protein
MTGTETINGFPHLHVNGSSECPDEAVMADLLRVLQRHPLSRRLWDGRWALRWADRRRLGVSEADARRLLRMGYLEHFTSPCEPVGPIPLLFQANSRHLHKGSWLIPTREGELLLQTTPPSNPPVGQPHGALVNDR